MALYNGKGQQILININNGNTATPDFSNLQGKYCLAIGDSYTCALAGANGALTSFNNSIGMAGTLNHGIISSTLRDKTDANRNGYAHQPIVCRVLNEGSGDTTGQTLVYSDNYIPLNRSDIGYIFLMGGTNDSLTYPTSTGTDVCDSDKSHIYGAMNLILQKLIDSYPNVPIIIGLQPCYVNQNPNSVQVSDLTSNYENLHFNDVTRLEQKVLSCHASQRKQKIVKEVAEFYAKAYSHIKVVDFCFDWYSPLVAEELSTYWQSDLLHLTGVGYNELVQGTKYDSIKKALSELFTV